MELHERRTSSKWDCEEGRGWRGCLCCCWVSSRGEIIRSVTLKSGLCGDAEGEAVREDCAEQEAEEEEDEEGEETGIEMEGETTEWDGGEGRAGAELEDGAVPTKNEEEEGTSRNCKPTGVV